MIVSISFGSLGHQIVAQSNDSQQPAFLKVIVHVNNTGGGTAQPSDFRVDVIPGNPSYFYGSEEGTIVAVENGNHSVLSPFNTVNGATYGTSFSGACIHSGQDQARVSIGPGEKEICTITKIYPNF